MFFGRYNYQIDAKGRLNFPAKFREKMDGESLIVMQWVDACLFVFSESEMERLSERLGADELMESWTTTGDLFSEAYELTPDKQGRILLPADLREYANLTKNVTIVGNCNHAEIWNTETWNTRRNAITNEQRIEKLKALRV